MEQLLYRPKEAAQALGIGRATLYDLLRSGRLRSVKANCASIRSRPQLAAATFRCYQLLKACSI